MSSTIVEPNEETFEDEKGNLGMMKVSAYLYMVYSAHFP